MAKKKRGYTTKHYGGYGTEEEKEARRRKLSRDEQERVDEVVERAQKTIDTFSKQPRFTEEQAGYLSMYRSLTQWLQSCELTLPEYQRASMARDKILREVWKAEPHWAAMIYQANLIDSNRAWTITGGRNSVRTYTNILYNANDGMGSRTFFRQQALSFRVTDMCTVTELGRDGDGKIQDGKILKPPLRAIYHVDSARCELTGNPFEPLRYTPSSGNSQNWKPWDYFRSVSSPSDDEAMNGLGYCATSRAIDLIRLLYGVLMYDQEQLGARMPKGLLFLHNITDEQWREALNARSSDLDSLNRQYFGGVMVLGSTGIGEQDAKLVALSNLPDNFTRETFIEQTWAGLSACLGYEMAEFWPAKAGVMGRGKETEIQHRKATTKGSMEFVIAWQERFQREIPQNVLFEFEQRDDEGDLLAAEVEAAWIDNASKMYNSGLTEGQPLLTWDEARSYLVDKGVIPSEWTLADEDVQATDTDDTELERVLDTAQVRRAMQDNEEIIRIRYDAEFDRFSERVIWQAGRHTWQGAELISRDMAQYEKQIRNAARAYRREAIGYNEFIDLMQGNIGRFFTQAWRDGAATQGFAPDEFEEPDDTAPLDAFIGNEPQYLPGFAEFIASMRDKPASALDMRVAQWAARWREVYQAAIAHFGKNKKMRWYYDPAKEHCEDCLKLNGQVRRASFWAERELYPLSMRLKCGPGRLCGCEFVETSQPVTRGPLPRLSS